MTVAKVQLFSHRTLTYPFHARLLEIHAKLNKVSLHVRCTGDASVYENGRLAYVDFVCLGEEIPKWRCCSEEPWKGNTMFTSHMQKFSEVKAISLSEGISQKTLGNLSLFEITVDDNPGKFMRLKASILRVLQIADQKGFKHVVFPAEFDYGDYQIKHEKPRFKGKISNIFPLLYFQVINDYALYYPAPNLHNIYIYYNHSVYPAIFAYMKVWIATHLITPLKERKVSLFMAHLNCYTDTYKNAQHNGMHLTEFGSPQPRSQDDCNMPCHLYRKVVKAI